MFTPRNLMIAGVVLIAVALGPSGHGLWWLVGLFWVLPHLGGRGQRCGGAARRHREREHDRGLKQGERVRAAEPDPSRDRHEAFPGR